MLENGDHVIRHTVRVAFLRAFPGELCQCLLRSEAGKQKLFRVLVSQLIQRKAATVGNLGGAGASFRVAAKEAVHFLRGFKVSVRMALAAETGIVDGAVVADAGDDVLQNASSRHMEQHVVGDHCGYPRLRRHVREFKEAQLIVRTTAQGQCHIGAVTKSVPHAAQIHPAGIVGVIRHQDGDQPLAVGHQVGPIEPALRLAAALFAKREQPAQPRIGRAIGWINQHRHAIGEIEAAANDKPYPGVLRRHMGADNAGQAVAVGNRQLLDAEIRGLGEQLLAGTGPAQKTEMRGALQLGIFCPVHPKIPCRNQRCEPVAASSPSPAR